MLGGSDERLYWVRVNGMMYTIWRIDRCPATRTTRMVGIFIESTQQTQNVESMLIGQKRGIYESLAFIYSLCPEGQWFKGAPTFTTLKYFYANHGEQEVLFNLKSS